MKGGNVNEEGRMKKEEMRCRCAAFIDMAAKPPTYSLIPNS